MIKEVYITKYALTSGVMKSEMDVRDLSPSGEIIGGKDHMCYGKLPGYRYATGFYGNDFHLTRKEALQDCEKRRIKKIAALKKQISKIENLKFDF